MITDFDFSILDYIQQHLRCNILDAIMPLITLFGEYGIWWICVTLMFIALRTRRSCGLTLAAGIVICALLGNVLLKNIIARDRPCWINESIDMLVKVPHDYSFPSGHTMISFTCAVILVFFDKKLGIPAIILAAAVGCSRMYLYVHFPTDVFAGMIIGIAIGVITSITMRRLVFKDITHSKEQTELTV